MGGEHEEVTEDGMGKGIRFHINRGEVHFHDDANILKAAIPVAEFHNGWNQLMKAPLHNEWCYADHKNGTLLILQIDAASTIVPIGIPKAYWLDIEVTLAKLSTSLTFNKLLRMT